MPKASWGAIDGSPFEDELDAYEVYDGDTPPKGLYRMRLKMLRLKENKNGDMMLNGLLLVNEPAGSKKSQYNGYDTWVNLNITKQGARWVNNFLSALVPENKVAALRKAFWLQKVMIDKEDPANVLSIGGVKITENMLVNATLAWDSYGEGAMKPKTFSRPTDTTLNEDGLDASESDEDEDWESDDGEEPEGDTDEGDEEFDARAEELEAMTRAQLLKAAKAAGVSTTRGMKESAIIDLILDEEFPPEDEDEEPEEDEPEDEGEELEEEDEEVAEEEDEEPEDEPEPPKRTRRTRAAAAKEEPAKTTSRRRAAPAKEEPKPATRTRTGTRRKASGKPPF